MKTNLIKGFFWGLGAAIGFMLVITIWSGIEALFETRNRYAEFKPHQAFDLQVASSTYRFVSASSESIGNSARHGDRLLITGQLNGTIEYDADHQQAFIDITANVFDQDGVFLQHCQSRYQSVTLLEPNSGFVVECPDLTEAQAIGDIRFAFDVNLRSLPESD